MDITRAKFNQLTEKLVDSTIEPLKKALSDAGLKSSDIDKIVLVGGSTRIPAVQEAVEKVTLGNFLFKEIPITVIKTE